MRARKELVALALCGLTGMLPSQGAVAKDLDMLIRLLVPAYMAQNFVAICRKQDFEFPAQVQTVVDAIGGFAEHVKAEVTADLAENEASSVRHRAADTALRVAEKELHQLAGPSDEITSDALSRWCGGSAKHFVIEIVHAHSEKHVEFERLVAAAKR